MGSFAEQFISGFILAVGFVCRFGIDKKKKPLSAQKSREGLVGLCGFTVFVDAVDHVLSYAVDVRYDIHASGFERFNCRGGQFFKRTLNKQSAELRDLSLWLV